MERRESGEAVTLWGVARHRHASLVAAAVALVEVVVAEGAAQQTVQRAALLIAAAMERRVVMTVGGYALSDVADLVDTASERADVLVGKVNGVVDHDVLL